MFQCSDEIPEILTTFKLARHFMLLPLCLMLQASSCRLSNLSTFPTPTRSSQRTNGIGDPWGVDGMQNRASKRDVIEEHCRL